MAYGDKPPPITVKSIARWWALIFIGSVISILGIVWAISESVVVANWNTGTSHRMRMKGPCIEEILSSSDAECWHPQHRIYASIGDTRTVVVCRCEPPTPEMMNWNPTGDCKDKDEDKK